MATDNVRDRKHWETAYRVAPLVRRRSKAQFELQEYHNDANTVPVTLTVPWAGDPRLLLAGLTASSGHPQPRCLYPTPQRQPS